MEGHNTTISALQLAASLDRTCNPGELRVWGSAEPTQYLHASGCFGQQACT